MHLLIMVGLAEENGERLLNSHLLGFTQSFIFRCGKDKCTTSIWFFYGNLVKWLSTAIRKIVAEVSSKRLGKFLEKYFGRTTRGVYG